MHKTDRFTPFLYTLFNNLKFSSLWYLMFLSRLTLFLKSPFKPSAVITESGRAQGPGF